jgi:hypothetical protein
MLLNKYSDFGGGKKRDSEFLSYNLMLNTGKNFALCATNKINILTLVLSEKKILNEKKTPSLGFMFTKCFDLQRFVFLIVVKLTKEIMFN